MKTVITNLLNPDWIGTRLRELGPYFLVELIVPGGSVIALLLWWHRHHHRDQKPCRFPCKAA
jgi:hypothetical protein